MKSRFEVLSEVEIEQLHAASMNVLAETGVKVEYNLARNLFREAGCLVTDEEKSVRIPEKLVKWAVNQAPDTFTLYGIPHSSFRLAKVILSLPVWAPQHPFSIIVQVSTARLPLKICSGISS